MIRVTVKRFNIFFVGLILVALASCRDNSTIPAPSENGYAEPEMIPLNVSAEQKFKWPDSVIQLHPVIRKIDFSKLPEKLFDSAGFQPFTHPPVQTKIDLDHLPDTVFNYDALPFDTMRMESFLLEPPKWVPGGKPKINSGRSQPVFSVGEAFSGDYISCVYKDPNGFIWIVTDQALYRYDGENTYQYFRMRPGQLSYSMLTDKYGQLWLGTQQNSPESEWNEFLILDPKKGILKRLNNKHGLLKGGAIVRMIMDKNGLIWATKGKGIVEIIDQDKKIVKHLTEKNGLRPGIMIGILQDDKENIWISSLSGEGLRIVDTKKGRISYLDKAHGLASDSITAVMEDSYKNIWLGTMAGAIDKLDPASGINTSFPVVTSLFQRAIFAFYEDGEKNIYANSMNNFDGTGNGITVINPATNTWKVISVENGLGSNRVERLVTDNLGQTWITTSSGLNMMNRNGVAMKRVGKTGISTQLQDKAGRIWIGTLTSGVEITEPTRTRTRVFSTRQGLSDNLVQNIIADGSRMVIGSNRGIDILDSGISTQIHLDKKTGLTNDTTLNFLRDPDSRLWFAAGSADLVGLYIIDLKKFTMTHLGPAQGLDDHNIADIKSDTSGRLWTISSRPGKVAIIDPKNNTIRHIDTLRGLKDQYSKLLFGDLEGAMWIGTGVGLYRVNTTLDSARLFTERDGLSSNIIISIQEHNGDIYVGTRTGLSILRSPKHTANHQWTIENYGRSQGLVKQANSYNSDMVTREGEFWWGDWGLTILKRIDTGSTPPRTYISGLSILNQQVLFGEDPWTSMDKKDTLISFTRDSFLLNGALPKYASFTYPDKLKWDSLNGPYNLPVNLRVPHDQNYLQFHFGQANLGARDTVWYRYLLQGVDRNWSAKTSMPFSQNYLNLAPGGYTFWVSSMYNGVWQEPAEFSFTVTPPWWKSWWAYCVYALMIVAAIGLITRYRSGQLQKENALLEQKVQSRTNELRKSLENLQQAQIQLVHAEKMASLGELTAGIAHEIQNPLNFVNNFSEVNTELIEELKNGPVQKLTGDDKKDAEDLLEDLLQNMNKITHHGKRADGIVKGMLQHSRTSTGQKEPTNINSIADEYLRLSYHGLRAKDKTFNATIETDFDEKVGQISVIPQDIGRVLLNLFNNAFYAVAEKKKLLGEEYKPTVSIATKKLGPQTEIRIRDNGMGIPQKLMDKIFQPFFTTKPSGQGTGLGLSLSYDIISKGHGGDLKVETKEGEGALFIITLPNNA